MSVHSVTAGFSIASSPRFEAVLIKLKPFLEAQIIDNLKRLYSFLYDMIGSALVHGARWGQIRRVDEKIAAVAIIGSIKEALYKALDPWVRRYVGFHEVSVRPFADGTMDIRLFLEDDEGQVVAEGSWFRVLGRLVAIVRVSCSKRQELK